ncbi:TonB family C-terminal domain [Moraxella equi]|uniref:TonB family C-terminal domain n=1 Tax=Moraxella equi TaxID=60442 RepID=A0A378QR65_9GAMM|nr:hypothetical protein B5J93_05670 [Moraxella equi]STZ01833.1 TonB family C-terminal domain [Moraxella equi]
MVEKGLTNSQKGVVWCLVVAGHSLAVWGLLWTKVPQLPSAVVTPLQVEWIELANLATPATPTNQTRLDNANPPKSDPKPEQTSVLIKKPIKKSVEQPIKQSVQKTKPAPKTKIETTPITGNQTPDQAKNTWTIQAHDSFSEEQPTNQPEQKTTNAEQDNAKDDNKQSDNAKQGVGNQSSEKDNQADSSKISSSHVGSGKNNHSNTGSSSDNTNQAKSNALEQSWAAKVRVKIEKNLDYPEEALSKKWSGKPTLKITIDKTGRVLSASVAKSSGKSILDKEAIATAQRASPLPAPPDEIMRGASSRSFIIPVRFDLKSHR